MGKEIERKFLLKTNPHIELGESIYYERYFLFRNENVEIRIQKKGTKYEFERKGKQNNFTSKKEKFEITEDEFDALRKKSSDLIIRESFIVNTDPEISLKVYHGKFKGLQRIEVEFENENSAKSFIIPDWFGKEITNSPLGRDSTLINLTEQEFKNLLNHFT